MYSDDREWFLLFELQLGVLMWPVLPESLTRLSLLIGAKTQENGVYPPTVYQMMFGHVSCSQFLLPPKKTPTDCIQIFGAKRADTSWVFFIMTSLQSGLQPMIDSLASTDKQKSSIGGYLSWSPMISLSFLLTCSKKNPCFLDKVLHQLMPSLYPDKDRVIDCILLQSSSTGFR